MVNLNQVSIRINDFRSFHGLLEVYEDLAAQKMQKIRDDITKYREYTKTLNSMSSDLGTDVSSIIKKNKKQKAAVLISSDKGLYGEAFLGLGNNFSDYLTKNKVDAFVVGSLGIEILKKSRPSVSYQSIKSDELSLENLWKSLGEYQEIDIFYLRYDSLAKQSNDTVHISGDVMPSEKDDFTFDDKNKLKYIYEPSVTEVAEVFAKEILSFLAEQTMKESDLAKYAARLMYLDSCLQRNNENIYSTLKQKMILTKRGSNKRQNARISNYLTRNKNNQYV
jgi:F0F1-type ATP synthase gamma subunit